jgi:hypothetical protein
MNDKQVKDLMWYLDAILTCLIILILITLKSPMRHTIEYLLNTHL